MPSQRPVGSPTRGTTAPNRLRRADRWLVGTQAARIRLGDDPPVMVDLGYGRLGTTTREWADRLATVRDDLDVVGVEISPDRVAAAQPLARPGLRFVLGGFEVPTPPARVIRAFNVLRQYDEGEVGQAWAGLQAALDENGVVVDGTCSELGRLGSWVMLDREGPRSLTLSWRLRDLDLDATPPSVVAERLPKALIHRNVPREGVHDLLRDLDDAWARTAGWATYGARAHAVEAFGLLARRWPVLDGPRRWRLGELTLAWEPVAPASPA
ncbi:class I SAM-dependent methyltransferase [Janibacter sp. Y6]|uniref:class I SAM-dependent methyltransferase n=1 Tax=Janibacter sp. Y6 TaxID=2913552 RepID=UPI0034A1BFC0